MLRILGSERRLCGGIQRRDFLQAAGWGLASTAGTWNSVATAASTVEGQPGFGRAKSVILLFLYGGASQLETFDSKPDAPAEVRGELGSIPTRIPGYSICEGLPRISQMIDRTTVIRSMTHPYPIHGTAFSVTSTPFLETPMQDNPQDPRHWPFIGSIVDYLDERRGGGAPIPRNLGLPFLHSSKRRHPIHNAGPYAAYLGKAYDPIWTDFEGRSLHSQKYHFASEITTVEDPYGGVDPDCRFLLSRHESLPEDVTLDRLRQRRSLLDQFDEQRTHAVAGERIRDYHRSRERAYQYLTNGRLRDAIDLRQESSAARERYGMTLFGQACLVARRLVQSGGRFVTVFWDEYGSVNSAWDTHYWHYPRLKEQLLPGLDQAYSALILDLEERGMLEETLVLCITEHGRTPKLDPNGDHPSGRGHGGRNHWSRVYSSVLAGAGIARGKLVGRSDRIAGEVADLPVSPQDVLATTYYLLGIDPHTLIQDRAGRPVAIGGSGRVLTDVLA